MRKHEQRRASRRVPTVELWLRTKLTSRLDERQRLWALRAAIALVVAAVIALALLTPGSPAQTFVAPGLASTGGSWA